MASCASLFCSIAAATVSLKDDLGRAVALPAPARRVVTLAPFLTELAFTVGAGAQVVGVSAYSDYPAPARALPQVATAAGLSLEQIAALRPDLVLAWSDSVRPEDIARLEGFGTAVFVAKARRLADVPRLMVDIGALTGHDGSAPAREFDRQLAALRSRYAARPRLAVFIEIWNRPLMTLGAHHFVDEALAVCGADNIFADLPGVAPLVSWEELYARNPQAIVGAGSAASEAQFRANWQAHGSLAAVKAGRLVFVDADRIERPTARTPSGIAQLCAGLERARSTLVARAPR